MAMLSWGCLKDKKDLAMGHGLGLGEWQENGKGRGPKARTSMGRREDRGT